jgi:YegS/Rv2252/BmrU family lipid kinase
MDSSAPVPREASLVVNTHSRRGRKLFQQARLRLAAAGITLIHTVAVRNPAHLNAEVRALIKSGAKMVIVGGGDGSISGTVDEFVGQDCVFALLPLGTANSFARTLGIPLDLEGAVDAIATGRRARIDLGSIDGDFFANVAAIGMPSLIGSTIPDGLKGALGRFGYIFWALWCLLRFRPFDVTLTSDAGVQHFRALELRVANGSYLGGTEIAEEAEVDSGDIIIQIVTGNGWPRLAWHWFATSLKLPVRRATAETIRARAVRIETAPPLPISIDGEVTVRTPVTASVARGVIEVVVPR